MDCKKMLARINNKEKTSMAEYDDLVEFAELKLSFFDQLGHKGKLQRLIKNDYNSIIHLLNEEARPNVLKTKTHCDEIKDGILKYAIEYMDTCLSPDGIIQLNSNNLSAVYDMAYSQELGKLQNQKQLRTYLENDDTFKKIIENLFIGDFPRVIERFECEEAKNSFLSSLNKNYDTYMDLALTYSDLNSELLFNKSSESAYCLLSGNFERFYNRIKEDRSIINLIGDLNLKKEFSDHPEFKDEIQGVIEEYSLTDDFKDKNYFKFVCGFCSQTDNFEMFTTRLEELFNSRHEDVRIDILSEYVAKYYQNHKDKEDDFKNKYLSFIKDRFNNNELESEIDYEWFMDVVARIDRPFLFENLEKISDLVTPYRVNDFFTFIETTPNAMNGMDVLSKKSKMLLEKTDTPLKTLKMISKAENRLTKRLDGKIEKYPKVDKEELKEVMAHRVNDIAYEIGSEFQDDPRKIQLLEALLNELIANEHVTPYDVKFLNNGSYSRVYQVGEKVLKIGREPEHFVVPKNHKRLIQPLIRRKNLFSDGERRNYYIEISEACDMSEKPTGEQLYQVYKELRDDGLIWTDAFEGNVGKLKKANRRYFDKVGEVQEDGSKKWGSMSHADSSGGLGGNDDNLEKQEILDKNEFVVIDLDYIFDENDTNIFWPKMRYSRDFERKYQVEKNPHKKERDE